MSATSLDLSQIKTDALSSASTFRTLIGLGTSDTPTFKSLTLTSGAITTNVPVWDATATWNNAATTFTGLRLNVTDTASNASSLLMDLQTAGVSRFSVSKDANIFTSNVFRFGGITTPGTLRNGIQHLGNDWVDIVVSQNLRARFKWANELQMPISSRIDWLSNTDFPNATVQCSLVPSLNTLEQRNSTNAQTYRVYNTYTDASNYERGKLEWSSNVLRIGTEKAGTGSARALELQTDGTTRLTIASTGAITIANALDIAVGTTTGTKIGTATTQKLGFFNKTPVVQPAAVADATDAASVITQLNLLLGRMRDLGLIAT